VVSVLEARGLVHAYGGGPPAVDGLDLDLVAGELVCVLGPNGSGKSTLLRLACGLLTPASGTVSVTGRPLASLAPRERARELALIPAALRAVPDRSVAEFVLGGRYAHRQGWSRWLSGPGAGDRAAVERALAAADGSELADRRLDELSSGQFQRVLVARALAQEARLLLCDEPTTNLDPEHQVRVFLLLERLVRAGHGVLVATHDFNLASRFAQRVLILEEGHLRAVGPTAEMLTREQLEPVFGRNLHYGRSASGAHPLVVPWPAEEPEGSDP
jgi:iron complex transport system ATP-binding protein